MVTGPKPTAWSDLSINVGVLALTVACWLYVAAGIGCVLTSGHWIHGSWSDALGVIRNPSTPAAAFADSAGVPGPVLFWT
jgi:hypothetical protein